MSVITAERVRTIAEDCLAGEGYYSQGLSVSTFADQHDALVAALQLIRETASAAEWAADIDTARKRLDRIYAAAAGALAKAGA